MRLRPVQIGALVVAVVLLSALWGEYGKQLRATAERRDLNAQDSSPFFPPRDARADAILSAARAHLNAVAEASGLGNDPAVDPELKAAQPAGSDAKSGEVVAAPAASPATALALEAPDLGDEQ